MRAIGQKRDLDEAAAHLDPVHQPGGDNVLARCGSRMARNSSRRDSGDGDDRFMCVLAPFRPAIDKPRQQAPRPSLQSMAQDLVPPTAAARKEHAVHAIRSVSVILGEGGSNRPPGAPPPPDGPWAVGRDGPTRGPRRPTPPDLDALIARLQGWRSRFGGRPGGSLPSGGRAVILVALLAVVLWLGSGFYRVESDEQGVVLRFGAFSRTTLPGLNYHLPWPVETVFTPAVTRINRTEIGSRSAVNASDQEETSRPAPQESLMLTGDENIIDIDLVLLWRIDNAVDYLFNTRDPDVTVKAVAESVLREVMGRTPIQPALGPMRAQIAADVMEQTQRILDGYHAGVQITQVLLQKVDPPAAVIESFRDVQRANTDAERMRNEARRMRMTSYRAPAVMRRVWSPPDRGTSRPRSPRPRARRSASFRCSQPIAPPRT